MAVYSSSKCQRRDYNAFAVYFKDKFVQILHFYSPVQPYMAELSNMQEIQETFALYSSRIRSAISAMNSELVGFPFPLLTV